MKPYSKKQIREVPTPKQFGKKKKEKKIWLLEFRWKSKRDFDIYPKGWFSRNLEFSLDWQHTTWFWDKFLTAQAALDSIKSHLRNIYGEKDIAGREWRVRNLETEEVVLFENIENYYK